MDRNYLAHRHGDFNNAILAAAGYNFRRLIRWLRILLRLFLAVFFAPYTNATEKRCPGRCLWRVVVTKIDGRGDVDCTDLVICCWPSPEAIPGFRSKFRD